MGRVRDAEWMEGGPLSRRRRDEVEEDDRCGDEGRRSCERCLAAHGRARTNALSSVVYMSTLRCVTQQRNVTSGREWEKIQALLAVY